MIEVEPIPNPIQSVNDTGDDSNTTTPYMKACGMRWFDAERLEESRMPRYGYEEEAHGDDGAFTKVVGEVHVGRGVDSYLSFQPCPLSVGIVIVKFIYQYMVRDDSDEIYGYGQ